MDEANDISADELNYFTRHHQLHTEINLIIDLINLRVNNIEMCLKNQKVNEIFFIWIFSVKLEKGKLFHFIDFARLFSLFFVQREKSFQFLATTKKWEISFRFASKEISLCFFFNQGMNKI